MAEIGARRFQSKKSQNDASGRCEHHVHREGQRACHHPPFMTVAHHVPLAAWGFHALHFALFTHDLLSQTDALNRQGCLISDILDNACLSAAAGFSSTRLHCCVCDAEPVTCQLPCTASLDRIKGCEELSNLSTAANLCKCSSVVA